MSVAGKAGAGIAPPVQTSSVTLGGEVSTQRALRDRGPLRDLSGALPRRYILEFLCPDHVCLLVLGGNGDRDTSNGRLLSRSSPSHLYCSSVSALLRGYIFSQSFLGDFPSRE